LVGLEAPAPSSIAVLGNKKVYLAATDTVLASLRRISARAALCESRARLVVQLQARARFLASFRSGPN